VDCRSPIGTVVETDVGLLQLSPRSALALLLAFHTRFSTWCSVSARKYSPKHFQ
jgi:hypothetical protein